MTSIHPEVKEKVDRLIAQGHTEGKFAILPHAQYMAAKLKSINVPATITEKLGHATTIDTAQGIKIAKHFHVYGNSNTAHRILGKFV